MIPLSGLVARALPHPNCPDLSVRQALIWACREFCQETLVNTVSDSRTITPLDIVGDGFDVAYTMPTDCASEAMFVLEALRDGRPYQPIRSDGQARVDTGFWQWRPGALDTIHFFYAGPTDFVFASKAAIRPTMTATAIPDELSTWVEGLISGARSRLFVDSKAKWFSMDMAAVEDTKFRAAIGDARSARLHGFSDAPLRVQPRVFV